MQHFKLRLFFPPNKSEHKQQQVKNCMDEFIELKNADFGQIFSRQKRQY